MNLMNVPPVTPQAALFVPGLLPSEQPTASHLSGQVSLSGFLTLNKIVDASPFIHILFTFDTRFG